MVLNGREVYLACRITDALDPESISAADATLSPAERARRDGFRLADDRRDYTIAHDLLRRTLSRYSDVSPDEWDFGAGAHGQPLITGPARSAPVNAASQGTFDATRQSANADQRSSRILHELAFSLSHTCGVVACAVASGRQVGVDVERIHGRLNVEDLAGRLFSDSEAETLRRCPAEMRSIAFVELWTLKEAFVKATGRGLSQPLNTFSFAGDKNGPTLLNGVAGGEASFWRFALFVPSPHTRMAVAVFGSAAQDVYFNARLEDGPSLPPIRPVFGSPFA